MDRVRSIAVTGKGGTGKTVLATLLIRLLAERFPGRVLAIDADSAMSLPYTLGLELKGTVSEIRKNIIGSREAKEKLSEGPTKSVMRGILAHGGGFDLLAMGRPEEPGCFCAVNELLRYGIDTLITDYEAVVIDGEAGPEQLNRRVLKSIDVLLVAADMSARSLETAAGIIRVANSYDEGLRVKRAGLILNRVRGDRPGDEVLRRIGLEIFGILPEDDLLNEYDREGRSLLELPLDSPCPLAAREILDRIMG
ncbi:MAG: AAA family ATPase [Gracilibacteraceae bacterium]|jgi:CO dehydrogenase maturation factor|nr:AAA family ATPase [Gracilibacteraceae bacterium]